MCYRHSSSTRRALGVAAGMTLSLAVAGSALAERPDDRDGDNDPLVFQFSTFGDTRGTTAAPSLTAAPGNPLFAQDRIWAMNTKAFTRILRSVHAQKSSMVFVNGDLVLGYGDAGVPRASNAATGLTVADITRSDIMTFYRQYGFWRGLAADLMETGTYVVPVAGNHEIQWSQPGVGKHAVVENENAWRANMGDLILDQSRLGTLFPDWTAAGAHFSQYAVDASTPAAAAIINNARFANVAFTDRVTTDQSGLTYSFDFRGSHYAVINTDATGWDSHAPVAWLAQDFAAAQARGVQHIFVFGHKPAFTYDYSINMPAGTAPIAAAGMDSVNDNALYGLPTATYTRDLFWSLIEQYGATYFCGHEHTYHATQPASADGNNAWQILVGSGGSPFDPPAADTLATDRSYSWATVSVHQSGAVHLTAYAFGPDFGPTAAIQHIRLH